MVKYYVRSFSGLMVEVDRVDFDFELDRLRNGIPDIEYDIYSGFGIQVSKWSYKGKMLLEEKEYFEAWEEIEENV